MSIQDLFSKLKAQGFHGHAGRPGHRGGSLPKRGGISANQSSKIITVGPRSGKQDMITVPDTVKLDANFMREGLGSYGSKGTKASILKAGDIFVLRVDTKGKGPAAFSDHKEHLAQFAEEKLGWNVRDET